MESAGNQLLDKLVTMQLEHKINLHHTKVYAYFPSVTNIKMATRKLPCRKHHPELIFFKGKKNWLCWPETLSQVWQKGWSNATQTI